MNKQLELPLMNQQEKKYLREQKNRAVRYFRKSKKA